MFRNKNLLIISLIAVVNALGYGIVIPILYSYSKLYGMNDFQNGLLFSIFSVCAFLATPIIGRMSDKYGRRSMLILSIVGTAVSFFMQAFAPNALFLFLARALDGLTAGNISVASAVISDTTPAKERARGFGIIGASFGFGFVVGPAISAVTVGIRPGLPFIIAGIISAIAVVMTMLFLPETNKHIGEVEHKKLFDFAKLWHALYDPSIGKTLTITLLYYFGFSCSILYGFQPFAQHILHLPDSLISVLYVAFGGVGLVSQLFLVQPVAKWLGIRKAFSGALTLVIAAFIFMFFTKTLALFIVASMILSFANSLTQPLIPTILSRETDEKSQGSIMGINASYQSVGQIFGPIIGGLVIGWFVPAIFLVGVVFSFFSLLLSFSVLRPGVHKEHAF